MEMYIGKRSDVISVYRKKIWKSADIHIRGTNHIDGKPHFVYSWKLEPTDKLPKGKKPCLSLRELGKQVNTDLDLLVNIVDGQMIVCELVDRYLKTKTGVRQSTKQ